MVRSFSFISLVEFCLCTMVGIIGYRTTILITDLTIFSSRTMGWYHFAHSGEQLFTVDGHPCTRGNSGLRRYLLQSSLRDFLFTNSLFSPVRIIISILK